MPTQLFGSTAMKPKDSQRVIIGPPKKLSMASNLGFYKSIFEFQAGSCLICVIFICLISKTSNSGPGKTSN